MTTKTYSKSFSEGEFLVCSLAKLVENGRFYWVAGAGSPLYAVIIARRLYAPEAHYITEDGVIDPEPAIPFDHPFMGMMTSRSGYRAVAWWTMNWAAFLASLGYMDYGILNTVQVDPYGNVNSTHLGGNYREFERRFGGPGGADAIAGLCRRLILAFPHEKRRFVPRVDFISSPGYLDGPGARERWGMPRDSGPWRVVTTKATFDFEPESRRMRLIAVAPWATKEEVLSEMGFEPLVAEKVQTMELPTEEELTILRTELDVWGLTQQEGRWIQF